MNPFRFKDFSSGGEFTWQPLSKTSVNPDIESVAAENEHLRQLMSDLRKAVLDPGSNKSRHLKLLMRHRTEWPFLWEKIDRIVEYGHNRVD